MKKKSQPSKLAKEEVFKLIEQVQKNKCEKSLDRLVRQYSGLVETIAKRYSKGGSIHEDLVQVGMIGLLNAIKRFDVSFGGKFETFAFPTIIGEMKRFLRDKTWSVHVPRRIKELYPKINYAIEEMRNTLERSPNIEEIARELNVSEENVLETIEMAQSYRSLSLDHKIDGDDEGGCFSILDLMGQSESGYHKVEQHLMLEKVSYVLTDREKKILTSTFMKGLSQKETGKRLGISQMHVSRLQRKALDKLKKELEDEVDHPLVRPFDMNYNPSDFVTI